MNTPGISAVAGHASQAVEAKHRAAPLAARPLTGAALRNASDTVQRAEVAAQFEAILLRQMLAPTMTSMLGSEPGAAPSVYGDLITDTFAQQLSRGSGFGLAHMIAKQLTPRGAAVADPSASSSDPL